MSLAAYTLQIAFLFVCVCEDESCLFFFPKQEGCHVWKSLSFSRCGSHKIELGLCWAISNVLIEKKLNKKKTNPRNFKKTLWTIGFMQRNHWNKNQCPAFYSLLSATSLSPVPLLYLTGVVFGDQHHFATGAARIQNFSISFSFCN